MLSPFGGVSTLVINGVAYRMTPNFILERGPGIYSLVVVGAPMVFTFRGVAGGGGGGVGDGTYGPGGGGGGAYMPALAIVLNPGPAYTLSVGAGGLSTVDGGDTNLFLAGVTTFVSLQGGRKGGNGFVGGGAA